MAIARAGRVGDWGYLSTPIRGFIEDNSPPWRDNAYMAFWSEDLATFGCYHASTSPNAAGRRARFSFQHRGLSTEVVEDAPVGTFDTPSLSFDLQKTITLCAPRISGHVTCEPLFSVADYSSKAIPTVEGGTPLTHYQQAGSFTGEVTFDGEAIEFSGFGFRDRTWGSRDESTAIAEYIGVMAVFKTSALTAIRMKTPHGGDHTEGFLLSEESALPVNRFDDITRDASGLFVNCTFDVLTCAEEYRRIELRNIGRAGGFWVPLGHERRGPTMSAYDEYDHAETSEGARGVAMIEQGVLRKL